MNISEDSSDGITLDNVPPGVDPGTNGNVDAISLNSLNQAGENPTESSNDLVFYLVVNPTSASSNDPRSGGIVPETSNIIASSQDATLDVIQSDDKANEDGPPYNLDAHLADVDSSQHLITRYYIERLIRHS